MVEEVSGEEDEIENVAHAMALIDRIRAAVLSADVEGLKKLVEEIKVRLGGVGASFADVRDEIGNF